MLLDHAFGGRWYDHVAGRPAYRAVPADALARAVALGEAALAGTADMAELDARSLLWRNPVAQQGDEPSLRHAALRERSGR